MTERDLQYIKNNINGDIEGFPVSLVVEIVERTIKQNSFLLVKDVMNAITVDRRWCFDWSMSTEGFAYWHDVICNRNFERYLRERATLNSRSWE